MTEEEDGIAMNVVEKMGFLKKKSYGRNTGLPQSHVAAMRVMEEDGAKNLTCLKSDGKRRGCRQSDAE